MEPANDRIALKHPDSSARARFLMIDNTTRLGHNKGSTGGGVSTWVLVAPRRNRQFPDSSIGRAGGC